MTAEALSAADGPSRVAPHGDAEELAEARQSVVDAVAARFIQVAEPDAAHGPDAPPNGAQANGVHVDAAPPNGMPIDAAQDPVPPEGDAAAVPTDAVPTDAAPTDAVPTDAVPTDAVPTDAVPADAVPTGSEPAPAPLEDDTAAAPAAPAVPLEGEPAEGEPAEPVDLGEPREPEEPPVTTAERPDVVGEVEEILEPAGDPDRSTAATAVLDVLRATGWADADEARELRDEADRLRELLDLVIRDHRAREASAVGLETQQHYWLIPLLRAAHGVAFGSLGAKVALRTAVQDVPEHILATAGLRIDYGVEPAGEAYEER